MPNKNLLISLLALNLIIVLSFTSNQSFAQSGVFITKKGDTIYYNRIEKKYPTIKYWVEETSKPIKILDTDIGFRAELPEYKLVKNETDEFSGNLVKTTEGITCGGNKRDRQGYSDGLRIWLTKIIFPTQKPLYAINMRTTVNIGCSGLEKNYVMIKLQNNEVIELKESVLDVDCERHAVSIFELDENVLNKLKSNEIKSIRLRKSEAFEDFGVLFPNFLIKSIDTIEN
jgi:hypothetical protein